jgi:hypothetical protein
MSTRGGGELTVGLYTAWNDILGKDDVRDNLILACDATVTLEQMQAVMRGEATKIAGQDIDVEHARKLRRDVSAVLNLYEQVVIAHRDDVANAKMVENYFLPSISRRWGELEEFVQAYRGKYASSANPTWQVIGQAITEAQPKREPARPVAP